MKYIAKLTAFLLWSCFANAQNAQDIRLWEKPFKYADLPKVFVSMDTATYIGIQRSQEVADMMIEYQKRFIESNLSRIGVLEKQKEKAEKALKNEQQFAESWQRQSEAVEAENKKLERLNTALTWVARSTPLAVIASYLIGRASK